MSSRAWWPPVQAQNYPSPPAQPRPTTQHGSPRTYMPADNLDWTSTSITFDIRGAAQPIHPHVASPSSPSTQHDHGVTSQSATPPSQTRHTAVDADKTAPGGQTQGLHTAPSCHPGQLLSRLAQVAPPEWLWQKHNLASLNLHLSSESSELLRRCFRQRQSASAPQGPQRCVLLQQPTVPQLLSMPLGATVKLQAVAYVCNSR